MQRPVAMWVATAFSLLVGAAVLPAGCSFRHGEAPDAGRPPDAPMIDADAAMDPPRSCEDIHTRDPNKPSQMYQIDPDGPGGDPAIMVLCDMTTAGGGWTIIFLSSTANLNSVSTTYTSSTPQLLADATSTLIAYRDSASSSVELHYATFSFPSDWMTSTPFDVKDKDLTLSDVSIDGGSPQSAVLRFGYGDWLKGTCSGAWYENTPAVLGRICIENTNAPFFTLFATDTVDDCSDSMSTYTTTSCGSPNNLRFSIAIR